MRRETIYSAVVAAVCVGLVLHSGDVSAQMAEDNLVAGPIEEFRLRMLAAQGAIAALLTGTFWLLATIEFTFALVMVAVHDGSMETFVKEIVIRILFIGFFFTLLTNGASWVNAIISTFTTLGAAAGGIPVNGLSPDRILDIATDMMKRSTFNFSILNPLDSVALIVAASIAFISLLLIAGNLALVLIEFYIVGYGGILVLALGGSRWTSDYAIAYLKYAFSIGMRLFIFYVLAGIGFSVIEGYIASDLLIDNINQFWSLAGFSVILCYVSSKAPDAISGLLNGVTTQASVSVASAARTAAATAAAASSGGASAVGGAAAVGQAFRLGSQQSGVTAFNAAANLAKAGYAEAKAGATGGSTSGSAFPGRGTVGGRMAANLSSQVKPSATSSGNTGSSSAPAASNTPTSNPGSGNSGAPKS